MATIRALNINDAVHKVQQHSFGYLAHDNMWDASHCPMLHNRKRNEGISYKDWSLLLAGRPKTQSGWYAPLSHYVPTNVTFREFDTTRCMAVLNDPYADSRWGYTLRPDGKNGRPIAEEKPLDEYFFYYPPAGQNIHDWYDTKGLANDSIMIQSYWQLTKWIGHWYRGTQWNGSTVGYDNTGNPFQYSVLLEPGCYAARICVSCSASYMNPYLIAWWYNNTATPPAQSTWLAQSNKGIPGVSTYAILQARNYDSYIACTNAIFFVDQPVYVCYTWWNGPNLSYSNCQWWVQLFRFTPPLPLHRDIGTRSIRKGYSASGDYGFNRKCLLR